MTPVTLIIDREFPGVGRIKKATGTTIVAVRNKMNRMLTEMFETGRLDLLREIRDNRLTLMEALDAHRRKALDSLATGPTAKKLGATWQRWLDQQEPGVDYAEKHIESMGLSLNYLIELKTDAVVNDLPALLEQLRDTLGKDHPRSFNLARSHASAFVRATLKRSHPLWLAINAVEPRPIPKRDPRPDITTEWMHAQFPAPQTNHFDAIAWAMALSGMGPGEFWGRWECGKDRINIHGTKRDARVRVVPLVQPIASPRISSNAFRLRMYRRFEGRISAYDFRRFFARAMERAQIVRARRKMYMGHAAGDVTALYEQHELDGYLVEDARALRRYLGIPEPEPTPLKVAK